MMILREWLLTLWIGVATIEIVLSNRPIVKLKFLTHPINVIIPEGSNGTLSCTATSTGGSVRYDWLINGSLVSQSTSGNHYLMNGNKLIVMNVQRHVDNEIYRCIATNDIGSILSRQASLQVAYFDILENSSNSVVEPTQFESLILRAPRVKSFPKEKVTWIVNMLIIHDGDSSDYITSDSSLNLMGVQKDETYRCIVENTIASRNYVKTYTIKVKSVKSLNMTVMKSPSNQTVRVGTSSVVFECIVSYPVSNGPRPPTIKWYKDNIRLTNIMNSRKYGYIRNDTALPMKLVIYNTQMNDAGVYRCQAELLNQRLVREATLRVIKANGSPPTCEEQLSPVLDALEGDQEEIDCPDDDQDNITCIWYRNGVRISSLNYSHVHELDGSLVFDHMVVQDSGLYQVMLRNDGGECMPDTPIYIKVQGPQVTTITTQVSPSTTIPWLTTSISTTPTIHTTKLPATTASLTTTSYHTTNIILTTTQTTTYTPTSTHSTTTNEPGSEAGTRTTGTTTDRVTVVVVTAATQSSGLSTNAYQSKKTGDLLIWIASGCGGFVVLVTVVIVIVFCLCKGKKRRKRNLNGDNKVCDDLEMKSTKKFKRDSTNLQDNSKTKGGVDTKRLLNDEEDAMYAPVLALENAACKMENSTPLLIPHGRRKSQHMYEEPIKTQRKPYNKPLPTLPRLDGTQPRPPSSYSYLELLGPTPDELQVISKENESACKQTDIVDENLYDTAREGILTNTLRRVTNQQPQEQPLYHILEGDSNACANRDSTLYASPEEILQNNDPVYQVLEASRPESMYQALVDCAASPSPCEQHTDDNIYQPLDKKARSTSAPGSTLINRIKPQRSLTNHVVDDVMNNPYSQSCPENDNCYVYSDDLYQPLNNKERCPLNVSKPKNSTIPCPARLQERRGSAPVVADEPTLYAIDVSPRGSIKENEKPKKHGHRRNLSDTHTIVNISRLTQRRASAGETLGLASDKPFPFQRKRNHSDFGLCPIDLSLLRVSIDFEHAEKYNAGYAGRFGTLHVGKYDAGYAGTLGARDDGKPAEALYMALVKSHDSSESQENLYSSLDNSTGNNEMSS